MAERNKWNPDLGPHGSQDGFTENYELDDPTLYPKEDNSPQSVTNFHQRSDVDSSQQSQHHTLGSRRNQSSPGNHTHDGGSSQKIPAANLPAPSLFSQSYTFQAATTTVDLGGGFIGARFTIAPGFTPSGGMNQPYDGSSVSNTYTYNIESISATQFVVSVMHADGSIPGVGEGVECYGFVWK